MHMINTNLKNKRGFTIVEILIVLGIMGLVTILTVGVFSNFKNQESLDKTSGLVIEILRQAKHSTIDSKNSNQYGVHFDPNSVVLYVGPTYSDISPSNQTYLLNSDIVVYSTNLNGGGNDVLFNKVTGETNNNGTIVLRSQTDGTTKTITIYKTGLIEQ